MIVPRLGLAKQNGASVSHEGAYNVIGFVPRERVIVFVRFPEPGQVKTRLIPALGPEDAAKLHTILARRTLDAVQRFCSDRSCEMEVRFAGGDMPRMRAHFGEEHRCTAQKGAGLGERLEHAISSAFNEGAKRVIVIGTDCPEMEPSVLPTAFDSLLNSDIVLNVSTDH